MAEEGMSLDEYVRQTLLAIVGGVLSAQGDQQCGDFIGRSPQGDTQHLVLSKDAQDNVVSLVKFDLATTVDTKSSVSGGAAVKVIPFFQARADGSDEQNSSLVSRMSFVVPISIPVPSAQRAEDAQAEQERKAQHRLDTNMMRNRPGGWAA